MINLQLKLTQRYYHFVAFRGSKDIIIKSEFLKKWKISYENRQKVNSNFIAHTLTYESAIPYYRQDINNNQREKPLYYYDLIVIEQPQSKTLHIGFPLRRIAVLLVSSLINDYGVLSGSMFINANLLKLIRANHKRTDFDHSGSHFWLGGVFIKLKGDSFLSNVKLAGDKPLDSDIYKQYFKVRLSDPATKSGIEKCLLKSKVPLDDGDRRYHVASTLHIDKFGNYKLYLQSMARNIASIPATFDFLDSIDCLTETSKNPVFHITNDES